ncbi:glycosyltransferase family 4 protein [Thioalkalivibrio sp. ALJ16]|uniref:glycosyltransferase family 4 protein n=1 Tax=Thioalkalivibrio sp. ALJ16 TaxID=1158762 RepID=UPI0003825AF4|nr:glycosyltransferase family 4 protein [Thioalkalivibrio sp. ALJ16]
MKVAIINKHIAHTVGGSELQCDFLAQGLHERGHEVVYIAPSRAPLDVPGYGYQVVPVRDSAVSLTEAVLTARPDVVYWRYNKHHFRAVSTALAAADIPMVFAVAHINDLLPWAVKPATAGWWGWLRQLQRRLLARREHTGFLHVRALTTNNHDLLPLSPVADAHYVPNGMSAEAEPFQWPRPYVAWVANVKPAKRPELFVEAARALADHGIDALMVGHIQSSGYDWLTDPARVPPNFHYLGPRTPTEVNGLLAGSRLHVHTCQPEGFPNVFIQAWMQGRPSVSLEFDPSGYIREQGLGAVADDDVGVFIQQLVDWAAQPERADAVGERARTFARETFSVDAMVERVERILASVAPAGLNNRDR